MCCYCAYFVMIMGTFVCGLSETHCIQHLFGVPVFTVCWQIHRGCVFPHEMYVFSSTLIIKSQFLINPYAAFLAAPNSLYIVFQLLLF